MRFLFFLAVVIVVGISMPIDDDCLPWSDCWLDQIGFSHYMDYLNYGDYVDCLQCVAEGNQYVVANASQPGWPAGACLTVAEQDYYRCDLGQAKFCSEMECSFPMLPAQFFVQDLQCGLMDEDHLRLSCDLSYLP